MKRNLLIIAFFILHQISSQVSAAAHTDSIANMSRPATNASDFYFFRSWNNPENVVAIMNVFPLQNPADGPSYAFFDENAVYRIHIDNDMDGDTSDVIYELAFSSIEDRSLASPFIYLGHPKFEEPSLRGITALSGPGSEGLLFKQKYTLTEIVDGHPRTLMDSETLIVAPHNAGSQVMPNYQSLAAQAIYQDTSTAIKVFAGPRSEATYADTGAFFAGLDFERYPPLLTPDEDANDHINPYGKNRFQRTNVLTIALEIPIDRLTDDGRNASRTQSPFVGGYGGVYSEISRDRFPEVWRGMLSSPEKYNVIRNSGRYFEQVSRVANPTFNLLVTDKSRKDQYNQTNPKYDAQHIEDLLSSTFATYLSQIFGIPVPEGPRFDTLSVLYKYPGQTIGSSVCDDPCADLLHLNLAVPPTAPADQSRLGALLSDDPAGLPNGRRPIDDVYDITLRAFGGPLFIMSRIGDGQNFAADMPGAGSSDGPGYGSAEGNILDVTPTGIAGEFPYLVTPHAPTH